MTAAVLITSFSRWGAFLSKPTSPCVSKNFCHRGAIPWSDILNIIHTVPENSLGSSFGGRFDFVNKEFTRACVEKQIFAGHAPFCILTENPEHVFVFHAHAYN